MSARRRTKRITSLRVAVASKTVDSQGRVPLGIVVDVSVRFEFGGDQAALLSQGCKLVEHLQEAFLVPVWHGSTIKTATDVSIKMVMA